MRSRVRVVAVHSHPMDLPIRITDKVDAPVLSVDGAFGAPGLNLSHWPGNTTPAALKRDLSTDIALAFVALPEDEQAALAAGCTALVNNHYDTDGVLAMFAVRHPELALPRREAMLAAATAGDLFRLPSEAAFALDRIVTLYCDPERSPLELEGLADHERYERATAALFEELPALLDGELESHAHLWRDDVARLRADLALLERSSVDEIVHLDLAVWSLPEAGDPGRHALWGKSEPDRQLVLAPGPDGTTARFLIGTKSWFDLVTERAQPRPDLAALAQRLNELEGCAPEAESAWRHQSERGASPELWHGTAGLANYSEHAAPHLAPSRIDPRLLKNTVVDAVRATWVFSDDPDDDDGGWEYVV